ncbi:pyridoxamine 5'-phosphate oxidase [Eremomyces bilateralis CBS 781.70]|uniref:pyridoxal 5'-phosphate synthase n=1 Tax=Eremomyces bilateralis CBS 781.70 TaxID=1392243 RepID=A0A6G1GGJ3_9PEZI|nr:pyridoxamine 5'-phosphate oxidase [Eremomyces bilateralis CBS 781.70]KAF1817134.1 pyridoxamine 5'-phosphate oxidase [Eremomyces bilateralis CBS 781.70]
MSSPQNDAPSPSSKLIFAPTDSPTAPHAHQFSASPLSLPTLSPSPLTQFHTLFTAGQRAHLPQPETCVLSTAALPSGRPSARTVYLKELDDRGFVIYSNTEHSRKAADLRTNPQACLTFWWAGLERQVRVTGAVERVGVEEAQRYFDTRNRESRVGAWASRQSEVLKDRKELEERVKKEKERWEGKEGIEVPGHWGGWRVVPEEVEFWGGREGRLHDRFLYTREGEGWRIERLSP